MSLGTYMEKEGELGPTDSRNRACTRAIGYSSPRCFAPRWLFATLYPATQGLEEGIIVKSLANYSWFETHHIHANPRNQGEQTEVF